MRRLLTALPSFLQEKIGQNPRCGQEHNIKTGEKCEPCPVESRLFRKQGSRGFHGGNEKRRENGKQQQRQKQFAHARMGRDGGKDGARYRQTQRAQPQDQRQPADRSSDRDIVENGEDGDKNRLGNRKKEKVRKRFAQQDGEGRNRCHAQRIEGVVGLLAAKRRMQHQRAREEKRDPQQPRSITPRFSGGGIEGKAEQHNHNERKNDRRVQEFARAKFEAEFLGEQNGGGASGRHTSLRAQRGKQKQIPRPPRRTRNDNVLAADEVVM